jgi:hypothetical protein
LLRERRCPLMPHLLVVILLLPPLPLLLPPLL